MENLADHTIKEKIINEIHRGDVKMKSTSYFVWRTILFFSALFLLFLFVVYLTSFMIFFLRISGLVFVPQFGIAGLKILFSSLPWLLILMSLGGAIILEICAEQFSFVYRRPLLYSFLGILGLVITMSILVNLSPFHMVLFERFERGNMPIMGMLYKERPLLEPDTVIHGRVIEIQKNRIVLQTPRGKQLTVVMPLSHKETPLLDEGDFVIVLGKKSNGIVEISHIKKIQEDGRLFPHYSKKSPRLKSPSIP